MMKKKTNYFQLSVLVFLSLAICTPCCFAQIAKLNELDVELEFKVTPVKAAYPVFKHSFCCKPSKTISENAATHYLGSLDENSLDAPWQASKEINENVYDWYSLETAAEDIPAEDLKRVAELFDGYVNDHIRRASLCRNCDWGLDEEDLRGPEVLTLSLSSTQETRQIGRALALRSRYYSLNGEYNKAIDEIRMLYKLGENVGKADFLVSNLIATAEIGMAHEAVANIIASKDSPNLYWALAELPKPFVDIREAMRLEQDFLLRYFPELDGIENSALTDEEYTQILRGIFESGFANQFDGNQNLKTDLAVSAMVVKAHLPAKKRLIGFGFAPDEVEKMPPAKIILVDFVKDFQAIYDDAVKSFYLPIGAETPSVDEVINRNAQPNIRLGALFASVLAPSLTQIRQATTRVDSQCYAMMAVESIRNHVATKGKLPESLEDLELPVPMNPFTNQPFEYSVEEDTAKLSFEGGTGSHTYWISIAEPQP